MESHGHASRRLRSRSGFTLTEIAVAMVIGGIIMAIAIPNMHRANMHQNLRSTTGEIESALRRARAKAVKTRSDVRVSINPTLRSCLVEQDSDGDGSFESQLQSIEIDEGIDIRSVALGSGGTVVFDERGMPDNPGTLQLFVATGRGREILVAAGSGSVVISPLEHTPTTP